MDDDGRPYAYIWEYDVEPGQVDAFVDLYGPRGDWSALFSRSPDYLRTELLRDRSCPTRFFTIDYWKSYEAWVEVSSRFAEEFVALDTRGDTLTIAESEVGRFFVEAPDPT